MSLGVDVPGRRIFLFGEINSEMSYRIVSAFQVLDSTKGPINISLNSPGGSETDGYAIYDVINMSKNRVTIEAYGAVQSMAAAILQAADYRLIAPECRFMIHNGSVGLHGDIDVNTVASLNKEIQSHTARYHKILAERSGQSQKEVERLCKQETFFNAAETVINGFADEVILP